MKGIEPTSGGQAGRGRAFLLTRRVALLLVPFLAGAGVVLYLMPDRAGELFAWPVAPRLTALLMGAGYLSGAYYFSRLAAARDWERYALAFWPITLFTWLSALATLLHWPRFNHSHPAFWAWAGLYGLTPLLVPALWMANRSKSITVPVPSLPVQIRFGLRLVAGLLLLYGAALFIFPQRFIPIWPWAITPITGRVIACWFILTGALDLAIALDGRRNAIRIPLQSQLVGLALILAGLLRLRSDLASAGASGSLLAAGMALIFFVLLLVYLFMESGPGSRQERGEDPES